MQSPLSPDLSTTKLACAVSPIPRFSALDPAEVMAATAFMKAERPVVITDLHLVDASLKWTPAYLSEHMGTDVKMNVFHSKTYKFLYWNDAKGNGVYEFEPPTFKNEMTCTEFVEKYMQDPPGEPDEDGFRYHYLQQSLVAGVGSEIMKDFLSWDWQTVKKYQEAVKFGPLTTNMMFMGQKGVETPCHYDEQQNLYIQVHGRKRIILFDPVYYYNLVPYPMQHPNDRQSQIDVVNPDLTRFPMFADAKAQETVLCPGEMLFMPSYWWHYVYSVDQTVSVNFWFKNSAPDNITFPLSTIHKVALKRNLENLLAQSIGAENISVVIEGLASQNPSKAAKPHCEAVTSLLEQVQVKRQDVPKFAKEWLSARFNLPRLKYPTLIDGDDEDDENEEGDANNSTIDHNNEEEEIRS